ncbi:MAG: NeuD/PglB/VioB family sugar acetyltransferase [Thermodesulfobacteriota bacterium]
MSPIGTRHIIIGCGAQCKYVLDIFSKTGAKAEAILDPIGKRAGGQINGIPIRRFDPEEIRELLKDERRAVIIGVSDNHLKMELFNLLAPLAEIDNAIHPAGVISSLATVGRGVIINAGAVIQPFAAIGNGVMVHAGVIVEHDNRIADFVNLAPGVTLAGGVSVGQGATIYSGTVVAPNVSIGAGTVVGAGSLVLQDLPDNIVAYGSPARITEKKIG